MSTEILTEKIRPFLKWPGGKYRLLDRIRANLPKGKRLIEPFVGAGSVFLNVDYQQYLLADTNDDLINLFTIIKKDPTKLIKTGKQYFNSNTNTEKIYYQLREQFNHSQDQFERATLFIYLNRHGFNGLCRYNNSGGYNVPFGEYKKPLFPEQAILHFHAQSQNAEFICADFKTSMQQAQAGDVVYCDPPYAPLSETARFTNYSKNKFEQAEQTQLAVMAQTLADRGVSVVISNHATDLTLELYKNATIQRFPVSRFISCDINNRKPAEELLAIFA